jgi:hypothetical protein
MNTFQRVRLATLLTRGATLRVALGHGARATTFFAREVVFFAREVVAIAWTIESVSLRPQLTLSALRGRVNGIYRRYARGVIRIGTMLVGWLVVVCVPFFGKSCHFGW